MIRNRIVRLSASLAAAALLGAQASLAAGPPQDAQHAPAGTWRLIPLPDVKLPAAWVINTETGETYLCGSGAAQGKARVACVEASFPPASTK